MAGKKKLWVKVVAIFTVALFFFSNIPTAEAGSKNLGKITLGVLGACMLLKGTSSQSRPIKVFSSVALGYGIACLLTQKTSKSARQNTAIASAIVFGGISCLSSRSKALSKEPSKEIGEIKPPLIQPTMPEEIEPPAIQPKIDKQPNTVSPKTVPPERYDNLKMEQKKPVTLPKKQSTYYVIATNAVSKKPEIRLSFAKDKIEEKTPPKRSWFDMLDPASPVEAANLPPKDKPANPASSKNKKLTKKEILEKKQKQRDELCNGIYSDFPERSCRQEIKFLMKRRLIKNGNERNEPLEDLIVDAFNRKNEKELSGIIETLQTEINRNHWRPLSYKDKVKLYPYDSIYRKRELDSLKTF